MVAVALMCGCAWTVESVGASAAIELWPRGAPGVVVEVGGDAPPDPGIERVGARRGERAGEPRARAREGPPGQGAGLGTTLVFDALRWMHAGGRSRCLVNTGVDNDAALALYERLGYAEVARRPVVREQWQTDGRNWVLMIKKPGQA